MADKYVICGPIPLGPIPQGSLGKLLFTSLLKAPSCDAMVDAYTGRRISYQTLLHRSCQVAEALRRHGCIPGTRVVVCSENSLDFFVPVLAALFIGAVVVPINHGYKAFEINHCRGLCQPAVIFGAKSVCARFVDDRFKDTVIVNIEDDSHIDGVMSLRLFIEVNLGLEPIAPSTFTPFNHCDPSEQVAVILSSSGTTGMPKGVMLTHMNIIIRFAQSRDPNLRCPDNIVLGLMPFFHGYGFNFAMLSFYNYDKIIVLKRFEEDFFLKTIQDYHITSLALAPPLVVFMAKTHKLERYDLRCIKEIFCGAAPLSRECEEILKERLHIPMIRQAYGLTESCLAVTVMMPQDYYKSGSCGRVIAYMQMKVIHTETGLSLGPNQEGEICVRGPMVMKGYYKDKKATAQVLSSDGWLKTGDLGYYDQDKFFYIVGRLKELIKYNGYQVAPAELEAILLNHPSVLDAGVVGIPNEFSGEVPRALVVKRRGHHITEKQLEEFVANLVSPQKKLRGGVLFVDKIPRNQTGKIIRLELKNMARVLEQQRSTPM